MTRTWRITGERGYEVWRGHAADSFEAFRIAERERGRLPSPLTIVALPEPRCAECHLYPPVNGGDLCAACSADQAAMARAHAELGL